MKEEILKKYDHEKVIYIELEYKIKDLINSLLKEKGITIHGIESRVKDRESLSKKIVEKDEKYLSLNDITDTLGLRVITYFEDDVDKVADILKEEFYLDIENSVDKRYKDPESFGYSSLHYILKLKKPRADLNEYSRFNDYKFELQIRSILQHAWAEIEHDLGYKSKIEIPKKIRRDFSRVAGLLEIADIEFIKIKDFLKNHRHEVEMKIEEETLEIPIDKDSMKEYLIKSQIISDILKTICEEFGIENVSDNLYKQTYLEALSYFGINEISQLDKMLNDNKDKIILFYKHWMRDRVVEEIVRGIPVFFLFYVLIYEDYSDDKLNEYCDLVFREQVKVRVIARFKELLKENLM